MIRSVQVECSPPGALLAEPEYGFVAPQTTANIVLRVDEKHAARAHHCRMLIKSVCDPIRSFDLIRSDPIR